MRGTIEGDWLSQLPVPRDQARWTRSIVALSASLLLHGLTVLPLVLLSFLPQAEAKAPYDAWAGDTFEVAMVGDPAGEQRAGASPVPPQPLAEPATEAPHEPESEAAPAPAILARRAAEAEEKHAREAKLRAQQASKRRARAERRARLARERRARERLDRSARKHTRTPRSTPEHDSSGEAPATARDGAEEPGSKQPGERDGAGSDPRGRGDLGAAGLPRGVRPLPLAFTRVLPRAAVGDSRLLKHGAGDLGDIRFTLRLDASGKIEGASYAGTPDPLLKALIERTLRFLGKGQFALKESPGDDLQGSQGVRVHLVLKQTSPTPDSDDPSATRSLGFQPPGRREDRLGFGYFELESGLRFEATIHFD
ncbi:MAG: hypothetical protein KC766_27305 [Myxococcales bacterium]|nr:hypothetical protein [Myxococcales bacterium]